MKNKNSTWHSTFILDYVYEHGTFRNSMYNIAELCISFMKIMMKSILPMAVHIIQKLVILFFAKSILFLFIFIFQKWKLTSFPLFIMCRQRNRGQIHSLPLYFILPHMKNHLSYCFPRDYFATINLNILLP